MLDGETDRDRRRPTSRAGALRSTRPERGRLRVRRLLRRAMVLARREHAVRAGALGAALRRPACGVLRRSDARRPHARDEAGALLRGDRARARRRTCRIHSSRALRRSAPRGRRRDARAVRLHVRGREPALARARGDATARAHRRRVRRAATTGTSPRGVRCALAACALRGVSAARTILASAKASSRSTTSRRSKTRRCCARSSRFSCTRAPERAVDPHDRVDAARARVRPRRGRRATPHRQPARRASKPTKASCTDFVSVRVAPVACRGPRRRRAGRRA